MPIDSLPGTVLEELLGLVQKLSLSRTLDSIVSFVTGAARNLVKADGVTFVLRDGDRCYYVDENAVSPLWKGRRFPMEICISGWVMLNRKPAAIPDIYADPRIPIDAYRPTFVRSLVMVPIRKEQPIGAIGAYWSETRNHSQELVNLLQSLADSISIAMENVALFERQERNERQLKLAKEQAEAANRAKSEFLAHMSHELRTPISGITGMVDILAGRIREPELKEHLSLVRESAGSLLTIVGDILDLSRIESGVVENEASPWDVRKQLERAVAPFRLEAKERGLAFSLTVGAGVPERVIVDGEKVEQAVRNLVSNAVKYTLSGSVNVTVGAGNEAAETGTIRLVFTVRDTGIGIPRDKQEAVFESFIRLRKSVMERNVEGTGLGLTITKKLVEILGGRIEVESVPGEGSTFRFHVDVVPDEDALRSLPSAGNANLFDLPPLSVLLVEDNRINQLFLKVSLEEAGHRVTITGNGSEALDAMTSGGDGRFDLVLMDVQMPVMDGIEATKRIRALDGPLSRIPVVALTAFAMRGDEERFKEAGMNGYVTKPVDWSELTRVIREVRGE